MQTLKEQIKTVLKDHGPWMAAGAIFNRVDVKAKETVVDALDEMVKAGDLIDWFGPLGGEYALPGTPPPAAASPTSTRDVKPSAFRIKSGTAPADYVGPAERRANRCTLAGDPSGGAAFTTEQFEKAKTDILQVIDLSSCSPMELCSRLKLTRAVCNTALSKLEAEGLIYGQGVGDQRRYRHGKKPTSEAPPAPASTPPPAVTQGEMPKGSTLQERVLYALRAAGPKGLTPVETYEAVGGLAGSVYASLSLLYRRGKLTRTKPGGAYIHVDHQPPATSEETQSPPTAPSGKDVDQHTGEEDEKRTLLELTADAVRAAGLKGQMPSEVISTLRLNAQSIYAALSLLTQRGVLRRDTPRGAYVHVAHFQQSVNREASAAPTPTALAASAASERKADTPRFALWSDGSFTIRRRDGDVVLDADETRAMCAYLDVVVTDLGELSL